jgi:hypothetical protein
MRVSSDKYDRDYVGDKRYAVTLDGEPVHNVIAADDERGYIVVHRMRDGRKVLNHNGDDFQRVMRWGQVVITEIAR